MDDRQQLRRTAVVTLASVALLENPYFCNPCDVNSCIGTVY